LTLQRWYAAKPAAAALGGKMKLAGKKTRKIGTRG